MNQKTLVLILLIMFVAMTGAIAIYLTWPKKSPPPAPHRLPEITIIDDVEPVRPIEERETTADGPEALGGVTEPVKVNMTFDELAEELGMTKEDIYQALGIEPGDNPYESVISVARRHGMTLEQVYQALEDY